MLCINKKSRSGFTLIELLVVISIVALLSSIVFAGLKIAQAKARDSRRTSDMVQFKNALELYSVDHKNTYPNTESNLYFTSKGNVIASIDSEPVCGDENDWNSSFKDTMKSYISLPKDPVNDATHCYIYRGDPEATFENPSDFGSFSTNFEASPYIGQTVGIISGNGNNSNIPWLGTIIGGSGGTIPSVQTIVPDNPVVTCNADSSAETSYCVTADGFVVVKSGLIKVRYSAGNSSPFGSLVTVATGQMFDPANGVVTDTSPGNVQATITANAGNIRRFSIARNARLEIEALPIPQGSCVSNVAPSCSLNFLRNSCENTGGQCTWNDASSCGGGSYITYGPTIQCEGDNPSSCETPSLNCVWDSDNESDTCTGEYSEEGTAFCEGSNEDSCESPNPEICTWSEQGSCSQTVNCSLYSDPSCGGFNTCDWVPG